MSRLLSQFFQRARGTAPLLHPRPPVPFEIGSTMGETAAAPIEREFEIDYRPLAPLLATGDAVSAAVAPAATVGERNPVSASSPTITANPAVVEHAVVRGLPDPVSSAVLPVAKGERAALDARKPVIANSPLGAHLGAQHGHASPAVVQARRLSTAMHAIGPGDGPAAPTATENSDKRAARTADAELPTAAALTPRAIAASSDLAIKTGGENKVAPPAIFAAASQPQETHASAAAALGTPETAAPASAAPVASQITGRGVVPPAPPAAAAPPAEKSVAVISNQAALAGRDAPRIEVRIGRIDIQVPPATPQPDQRPAAIGMSLDAFIAETRQ